MHKQRLLIPSFTEAVKWLREHPLDRVLKRHPSLFVRRHEFLKIKKE
jgi:hypothetical protein